MFGLTLSHKAQYLQLMRADKPVGIYLLLWPTLWGLLFAAQGMPPVSILTVFILGVIVMRSAGCVINDFADRKVDGAVERTKHRPLATGEVSEREAKNLFALLVGFAFILVLFLNGATILLSLVALLLASVYPFMKRYTQLPQVVLGAAFGWSIPMAFMAVNEMLVWWLWLLYLANLFWTVAYDTQYAMVDRKHDLKVGIKSSAILFGKYDVVIICLLQSLTLALLAAVFYINHFPNFSYLGLLMAAALFVFQYHLCKNRREPDCFTAFLNNNYVGMILTATIALSFLV